MRSCSSYSKVVESTPPLSINTESFIVLHVHAAINLDDLSADIAREVGSQESGNVSDILDLTTATEGNLLLPLVANLRSR